MVAAALGLVTAGADAVTIVEAPDWVAADAYYLGPGGQSTYPYPWPVVRFDVTNQDAVLGVYSLLIGGRPGVYDWASSSEPAMLFGHPWIPVSFDYQNPAYLPQKNNDGLQGVAGYGDGTIDWTTELLRVDHAGPGGHSVSVFDSVTGSEVSIALPAAFADYDHVYRFETTGPFVACTGGCARDSVPIPAGATFSFYVTGGLGSPFVYLDGSNYDSGGALIGTFAAAGSTVPVPEPAAYLLFAAGAAVVATATRGRRRKA